MTANRPEHLRPIRHGLHPFARSREVRCYDAINAQLTRR
jgi:hypothetical protein